MRDELVDARHAAVTLAASRPVGRIHATGALGLIASRTSNSRARRTAADDRVGIVRRAFSATLADKQLPAFCSIRNTCVAASRAGRRSVE
jgi:hypothetical protein